MSENKSKYIRWFDETSIEDVPLVGGKMPLLGKCTENSLQRE